ncbi:hypothetical protein [Nostoc sp. ChiQUE01b]|uniref:hypothetical protein n=1 Tax=Nostoc sp. ChiQUE01b TaxID=3075376 RepID=UPI002AD54444|nr:hypothetical protein [Nostoc sp. ChiQUE01b]MDZ8263976.1 hypothetical protein [Nostoc sp. ChiQUE01b]
MITVSLQKSQKPFSPCSGSARVPHGKPAPCQGELNDKSLVKHDIIRQYSDWINLQMVL